MTTVGHPTRRLLVWYAGSFAGGVIVLLAGGYALLSANLAHRDAQALTLRAHELGDAWESGGRMAMDKATAMRPGSARLSVSIARIFGPDGRIRYGESPDDLEDVDLGFLAHIPPDGSIREVVVTEDGLPVRIELTATALAGGEILVTGFVPRRHDFLARTRFAMLAALLPLLALSATAGALLVQRALVAETKAALDVVAHNLRTPLTRLSAEAERALADGAEASVLREALETCAEEAGHLRTELDALLDLSEAEAGGLSLDLQRVDASTAAEEAADLYRDLAEERGLTLRVTALPGLLVRADPRRLRQALANVLDNAVKYTPTGCTISFAVRPRTKMIEFSVGDTGPGIPAHELPRVFDRKFRGSSVGTIQGLGLGLSLVRALVRAQGGTTFAESDHECGTTITIRLPVA